MLFVLDILSSFALIGEIENEIFLAASFIAASRLENSHARINQIAILLFQSAT
jgi:hypothetical protein